MENRNPDRNYERSLEVEEEFRSRVISLGGIPAYGTWEGTDKPHAVICLNGHTSYPRPGNVQQGHGICLLCRSDQQRRHVADLRADGYTNFQGNLDAIGAKLLETEYLGSHEPHKVQCANAHICYPRPNQLPWAMICKSCVYLNWDTFYILEHESSNSFKLGITGQWDIRKQVHASGGYSREISIYQDLPTGKAREIEQACLIILRQSGFYPVKGREYFTLHALPTVLVIAKHTIEV